MKFAQFWSLNCKYLRIEEKIQKSPWCPKFYQPKLQNEGPVKTIWSLVWSVGGVASDFTPSTRYNVVQTVLCRLQETTKYKVKRGGNHWHPPLQPIQTMQFDHMRHHLKAPSNRSGRTEAIVEYVFLFRAIEENRPKIAIFWKFDFLQYFKTGIGIKKSARCSHLYLHMLPFDTLEIKFKLPSGL